MWHRLCSTIVCVMLRGCRVAIKKERKTDETSPQASTLCAYHSIELTFLCEVNTNYQQEACLQVTNGCCRPSQFSCECKKNHLNTRLDPVPSSTAWSLFVIVFNSSLAFICHNSSLYIWMSSMLLPQVSSKEWHYSDTSRHYTSSYSASTCVVKTKLDVLNSGFWYMQ